MSNTALKPSHLKVVDKAHSAANNYDNPEASKDWPVTPSYLSPVAQGLFEKMCLRISELYPPSSSHTEMIALYAQTAEEIIELETLIRWEGRTFVTDNGTVKANPLVAMLNTSRNRAYKILREFGLSPDSVRNVKVHKKQERKNAFADLDD